LPVEENRDIHNAEGTGTLTGRFQEPETAELELPGEPMINNLQRVFKQSKAIPKEMISGMSTESIRHLIEILINDKINLQDRIRALEERKDIITDEEAFRDNLA
jgi:hypothetical protein